MPSTKPVSTSYIKPISIGLVVLVVSLLGLYIYKQNKQEQHVELKSLQLQDRQMDSILNQDPSMAKYYIAKQYKKSVAT